MSKALLLNIIKWLWMAAVLAAFAVYLWQNFSDILENLSRISPLLLILSLLIAMLGRLCFIGLSSEVLTLQGYPQSFRSVFYLAATSELGKYLPGGVWHLLGRAAYYRVLGLSPATISRALIQENAWQLLSAGMIGSFFLIMAYTGNFLAIIALLMCWQLILYFFVQKAALWRISAQILLHSLIWLLFAYSFTMLLPTLDTFGFLLSMSAFCLSWVLGYLIIFAPGGLGVREAAIVAFLAPIMPPEQAIVYALVHRLLWILIELIFGLIAWVFFDLQEDAPLHVPTGDS